MLAKLSLLLLLSSSYIPSSQAAAECDLCITVVTAVEEYVLAGDTMEDIITKIEAICATMGALEPLCENLIEQFLPGIIEDILTNQLAPWAICQGLGLCTETSSTGPTTTPQPGKSVI